MSNIHLPFINSDHLADFWVCYAKVDDRRYFFFPLVKESIIAEGYADQPWFSFIITSPFTNNEARLLDFKNSSGGNAHNPCLYYNNKNENIDLTSETVHVSGDKKHNSNELYIESENKEGLSIGDDLTLQLSYGHASKSFLVSLVLEWNKERYKCNIRFFTAAGMVDKAGWGVLDFGSEASQYGIIYKNRRGNAGMQDNVTEGNIFNTFQQLYKDEANDPGDYWQYDYYSRDIKLLRTRIFVSKDKADNINRSNQFLTDDEALVYLKQIKAGKDEYLPNLKLLLNNPDAAGNLAIRVAGHTTYDCNNLDINSKNGFWQLYFSVMRTYLEALIKEATSLGKHFLHIKILLPNTISQQTVQQILYYLHQEVEKKILRPREVEARKYSDFEGFELECLPESDANLSGFLAVNNDLIKQLKPAEYVLSIDCGNGTTDIGIYEIETDTKKMVRVLRTGVPAAGNYLTFAAAIGLLDHYIKREKLENQRQEIYTHFFELLNAMTPDVKDLIWQKLHDIKRYYPDKRFPSDLTFEGDTLKAKPQSLLQSLISSSFKGNNGVPDSNILETTVNSFVNTLVEQVLEPVKEIARNPQQYGFSEFTIKHLMISGRGALFQPFLSKLIDQVRQLGADTNLLTLHLPGGNKPIPITQGDDIVKILSSRVLASFEFKNASIKGLKQSELIKDLGFLDYFIGTSANTRKTVKKKRWWPFNSNNGNNNGNHDAFRFNPFEPNIIYSKHNNLFLEGATRTMPAATLKNVQHFVRFNGFNYSFFMSEQGSSLRIPTVQQNIDVGLNHFTIGLRAVSLCPFFIDKKVERLTNFIQMVAHSSNQK